MQDMERKWFSHCNVWEPELTLPPMYLRIRGWRALADPVCLGMRHRHSGIHRSSLSGKTSFFSIADLGRRYFTLFNPIWPLFNHNNNVWFLHCLALFGIRISYRAGFGSLRSLLWILLKKLSSLSIRTFRFNFVFFNIGIKHSC